MGDTVIDRLCAQLTGTVANKAADEFYQEFNLISSAFSEYYLKEMMEIFYLPGMERWPELLSPEVTKKKKLPPMLLSMVCFSPPASSILLNSPTNSRRAEIASSKAREMLQSTFVSKHDHECIDVALDNFPTIAIFMAQVPEDGLKKRKNKNKRKSICDVKDNSSLHCIAAVNYLADGTHTQVLFLATTFEEPPVNSIHVTWQQLGLATYLLCMLVKQHTRNSTIQHSILSLQASPQRNNPARSFYLKLGFSCYNELEDNGLSRTSAGFQEAVQRFPELWVKSESMLFFRLCQGRLNLPQRKKLVPALISESGTESDGITYAQFPWPCHSMKLIEGYLETRPILTWLSGDPLPITDRPLITTTSKSKISGSVLGERRKLLNSPDSWLSTDEIQFLVAFLTRNQESNRFFHVLCPTITHKIAIVYASMSAILAGTANEEQHSSYGSNLTYIQDYIDTILDILQHKFLVFLCNEREMHWVSVVVINPFLVFDRYSAEEKQNEVVINQDTSGNQDMSSDEDFFGWCVINSNPTPSERQENGLQGTMYTKNKASYGVRLFLNICASYLKAKKNNEGDGRQPNSFHYEEPFGRFDECKGTQSFPRFDYKCPSILQQSNSSDCGLAVVANSMAFVKHSKDLKFMKANLERPTEKFLKGSNEVRFLLNEKKYSLKPFWDRLLRVNGPARGRYGGQLSIAKHLLIHLRQEYIEVLDEIAGYSRTTKKFSKEERRQQILDDFYNIQEQGEEQHFMSCDKCNISITQDYAFMIPNLESDAMKFIGHTPKSLRALPEFSTHFDKKRLRDLSKCDWDKLCQWPSNYVETYVALMSHAFHSPQVQCVFIPDVLLEGHGSTQFFPLGPEIKIVLAITYKQFHYAVLKMDLLTRKVVVWDAAGEVSYIIAEYWREHVLSAIRMHRPNEVEEEGTNVMEYSIPLPKNYGMPLWTVKGYVGECAQKEDYSCGPIAINHFAVILKSLSDGIVLEEDGIDDFIKFMDSDNENVVNAKCLFRCLLEKTHDLFKPVVDAEITMAASIHKLPPETKRKETAKAMALLVTAPIIHDTQITQNDSTVGTKCHAGHSCRMEDIEVVPDGNFQNGSLCCKCQQTFHYVCLFLFSGDIYCIECYKEHVVSQCETETLFCDLLRSKEKKTPRHKPSESDLLEHVDNFFNIHGFQMTTKEFFKWRQGVEELRKQKSGSKRKWTKEDRSIRKKQIFEDLYKEKQYKTLFELAKQEWLLSTDGIVKGLRYNVKDKKFVAKVVYEKGCKGKVMEQHMTVSDDWVIDTYGKEIANKLMDRAKHQEFIKAVDADGTHTVLRIDQRKITRVKYIPPTFYHKTDKCGNNHVTTEVCAKGFWKGMLEDGTAVPLLEEVVTGNFGAKFVDECKKLGHTKFVDIPVGSCKSSLMKLFPKLRCEEAPPVMFMQGEVNSCVFSSLASAFGNTAIPDLVRVAKILQDKSKRLCERPNCLHLTKDIVTEHVKWLQPKRLPKSFNWENDMNDYMFVVGKIKDSTDSCQHAVTIFRNWIYDSNEPFALPLSQESLDCCTWDIKDGVIVAESSFVSFSDGWIFKEPEEKKKKVLDKCAHAKNVNRAYC
jgi:hypothetical protein